MIFVTVGTHEQPFNRLVENIDILKRDKIINEKVIIQTGYGTYEPKYCDWQTLFTYEEMDNLINEARIIVTHGGPSSFIAPLQIGKIPIVVPRQRQFQEHVNDHQIEFCQAVSERLNSIILVENIEKLKNIILDYNSIVTGMENRMNSNNSKFNDELENIVKKMML